MREQILNQPIDTFDLNEVEHLAKMALVNSRQFRIVTLNPEMVINALKNFEFQAAINNSHLIVPDGTGIVWALKLLNPQKFKTLRRIAGIELAERIVQTANELSKKIAIFGGKKEVLEKTIIRLQERYSNLQIVKAFDGFKAQEQFSEIAQNISSCNPDVVLVALGSPKQEIWINNYASLFPRSILIGIGGSLDIWSGIKSRAPAWIRNNHMEWLFRALTEPQRIPRILKTLPQFICMILKEKIKY